MTKKITLIAVLCFGLLSSSFAQLSLTIIQQDTLVTGNAWVDNDLAAYAVVENVGALPVEVALRRIDENYTTLTDSNAICWGLCFTTNISQNPASFNRVIQPGGTDTAIVHVYPDLDGYANSGAIQYVLFDYFNTTDSVAFTVNFEVTGILSEPEFDKPELNVYPNPAEDFLRIQYQVASNSKASFELINLVGARVFQQNLDANANELEIDLSDLNGGVYFYTLKVDGEVNISKKLVIK